MTAPISISAKQVREIALHELGLTKSSAVKTAQEVLPKLGAVQLDTISVLARSHELVHYARVPNLNRKKIEDALWSSATPAPTFEYWSHAACVLPADSYPWFEFRRRSFKKRGIRWHDVPSAKVLRDIKRKLADGATDTTALGGANKGGIWWDWSEAKVGVEWLLDIGEVVCTNRIGWRRQYALSEQAIAPHLLISPSDEECLRHLILTGLRTLGVGTRNDISDVHRLGSPHVSRSAFDKALASLVNSGEVQISKVQGWAETAYMLRDFQPAVASKSLTTLLSPFDSLIWNRERLERIFGMRYRIEAYTPASKRLYGYFAMPVLHNGGLIARVDPGKTKTSLIAKNIVFESAEPSPAQIAGVAHALHSAKTWLNLESVTLEQVSPGSKRDALQHKLGQLN